jgi:type IV pilus assembly protein PilN
VAKTFHINLASEPFRRNRPIVAAAVAIGVMLVALLGFEIHLILAGREQVRETRAAIDSANTQLQTINSEQSKIEGIMRQPENAAVLDNSILLNALIRRKAISWTRLFGDLGKVMPHNVRLISVRPEVTPQNQISLQMIVGAQSTEPVLDLMKNLEMSPMFDAAQVQNWLPPSQSDPSWRYRLSVNYAQKL